MNGFSLKGISFSPVTGGEGNIEFLFHLRSEEDPTNLYDETAFECIDYRSVRSIDMSPKERCEI